MVAYKAEEFFIDSDFVHITNGFLSNVEPFVGLSKAGGSTSFLGVRTSSKYTRLMNPKRYEIEKKARHVKTCAPGIEAGEAYFEFGSLFAAVKEAKGKFYMLELGGGWGARSVVANAILNKINPLDDFYVVVEAMKEHCLWIKEHMKGNGIDPESHSIIQAVVWTDNLPQLFPSSEGVLGQSISQGIPEVIANLTELESKTALMNIVTEGNLGIEEEFNNRFGKFTRNWTFVSSITLRDILLPIERVDYMDVDIQGAERYVINSGVDLLENKVKRLHIGTHGLDIHDKLSELFIDRGWRILVQVPPNGQFSTRWGDFQTGDGILSVLNQNIV